MAVMEHCNCMMSSKMLNGLVEMNPQVSSMGRWCNNGNDEDCKDSIFEGLANGTILPFMECKPLCREQLFKVLTTVFLLYVFFQFLLFEITLVSFSHQFRQMFHLESGPILTIPQSLVS